MNDFVKIRKQLTDENPGFSYCEKKQFSSFGEKYHVQHYTLKNQYTPIGIMLNEATGELTLKCNLAMFWQGHNLTFSYSDMRKSLEYVSNVLNVDLFPAEVKEFDNSAIVCTALNPKYVIQNHVSIAGHETKPQKHGKYFVKAGQEVVKMYDAGRRLKQIHSKANREAILKAIGFDPALNLIRIEKKILKPGNFFKKFISVNELLNPQFISQCDLELMETYGKIKKLGSIQIPENKKDLSAAIIILIVARELEELHGFNFGELVKQKISSIDDSILSKEDKKARNRQFNANQDKISFKGANPYDLSEPLAMSLKMASAG